MSQPLKPAQLAKQIAFHDINENCKKERHGQNCVIMERAICEYVGIPVPDFRKFNGGRNKLNKGTDFEVSLYEQKTNNNYED